MPDSQPPCASAPISFSWSPSNENWHKHENAYRLVANLPTVDSFVDFYAYLQLEDNAFYTEIGGDILHAVQSGSDPTSIANFDERYKKLIQLFATFDLDATADFHRKAEPVYRNCSNTLVRYNRIVDSLGVSAQTIEAGNRADSETQLHSLVPMHGGFDRHVHGLDEAQQVLADTRYFDSTMGVFKLENELERESRQLTSLDDSVKAEEKWIRNITTNNIAVTRFYLLPNTRVSKKPTGVAFYRNSEWRYLFGLSDMYHYFRMAGKVVLGKEKTVLEKAYVLPRHGQNNHYLSLINKLPTLFGYQLLGLDCPIVAAYELSETEKHIAGLLNIDIGNILVDTDSSITIRHAIYPDAVGLRTLFVRHCAHLCSGKSPFGKRIYISRRKAKDRRLSNETALEKLVAAHGFDIVRMEELSLEQQIAVASNAELIAAPHGAGLANMIFAQAGCGILEFIPDYYMTPSFRQLAADCGHRYSVLLGQRQQAESDSDDSMPWSLDLGRVESVLRDV